MLPCIVKILYSHIFQFMKVIYNPKFDFKHKVKSPILVNLKVARKYNDNYRTPSELPLFPML